MGDNQLLDVFKQYAAFGRAGVTSDITSKNFAKMFKEKDLMDKKLNSTEVDMIFTRAKGGPGNKVLTFAQFKQSLVFAAKSKYGSDSETNIEKIRNKILAGVGPSTSGTTATSKVGGVARMTDTSKYTGASKERFDESGKGKGLEGRKDIKDDSGYVGNYKMKDTYDKKH